MAQLSSTGHGEGRGPSRAVDARELAGSSTMCSVSFPVEKEARSHWLGKLFQSVSVTVFVTAGVALQAASSGEIVDV